VCAAGALLLALDQISTIKGNLSLESKREIEMLNITLIYYWKI
jgi:hypothetical protein